MSLLNRKKNIQKGSGTGASNPGLTIGVLYNLPDTVSDAEYFQVLLRHAAHIFYPLEETAKIELNDQGPEGDSVLHLACSFGDLRAVRIIVESGGVVDSLDEMNQTPLHRAVNGRYLDIICYLLEHGASPAIMDSFGYSPKAWAIQMGYRDVEGILNKYEN